MKKILKKIDSNTQSAKSTCNTHWPNWPVLAWDLKYGRQWGRMGIKNMTHLHIWKCKISIRRIRVKIDQEDLHYFSWFLNAISDHQDDGSPSLPHSDWSGWCQCHPGEWSSWECPGTETLEWVVTPHLILQQLGLFLTSMSEMAVFLSTTIKFGLLWYIWYFLYDFK